MSAWMSRPGYDGWYSDEGCERRVELASAQREHVKCVARERCAGASAVLAWRFVMWFSET